MAHLGEDEVDAAEEDSEHKHGQHPNRRLPTPFTAQEGELEGGEDDCRCSTTEDRAEEPGDNDGDESLVGGEGSWVRDVPQNTARAGVDQGETDDATNCVDKIIKEGEGVSNS